MRNTAVCIHCGHIKKSPFSRCVNCGRSGNINPEEKAKSFMLSEEFLQGENLEINIQEMLTNISTKIKSNEVIEFDQAEISNLVKEQEMLEDIPRFQTIKILLFCMLFLTIPIIALLVWILS